MIVNEDFADSTAKLIEKLEMQLGDQVVKGVSMFFLIKQPDGLDKWAVISNYQGEGLSDANIVHLHQSVAKHIAKDFTNIAYGPED